MINLDRQIAFNRFQELIISFPEIHEADLFVDKYIRILSKKPERPIGKPAYIGLYGEGKSLNQYREMACDRLQELVTLFPDLAEIDEKLNNYIHILSNLSEQIKAKVYVTSAQLVEIVGSTKLKSRIESLTPGVNETFDKYQINTKLRMAHFLAQVIHESGGFQWLREIWGPTDIQRRYEGRRDLGNTQPGDGKRFMGRGLIQLTGRANYQQFSEAIGVDFISQPELVESAPYSVIVAGWYWNSRKINPYADRDDLIQVTKLINGGTIGLKDRQKYLDRAKAILS